MNVRPSHDMVLLEVLDSEVQFTSGGLVVSTSDRMYKRAKVLAVGPGRRHPKTDVRLAMVVEVGETVIYEDWRTQWHSGQWTWPGPGDRALVPQGAVVAMFDCDDDPENHWVEFQRTHGAPSRELPKHFDPAEAGGSFNRRLIQ